MIDFKSRWDKEIGLFIIAPDRKGHTADCFGRKELHSNPDSVSFITYAAQMGRLAEIDCFRILENIRSCQNTDGETRGLIKWYLEDGEGSDGNAPFFISIGLVPLRKYFAEDLGKKCCDLLDDILSDLLYHFIAHAEHFSCFYPNAFLGDLVFAWLINETHGSEDRDAKLTAILNDSLRYWTQEGWGWGEHMSDGYATVCCYELSCLLLMSERLPEEARELCMKALSQLLAIEEAYGGKPRVPVIRSYAFENTPTTEPFRRKITDWVPEDEPVIGNMPPLGQLLNRLNWHAIAPTPTTPRHEVRIPCHNNTEASAFITTDFRIGGMSHYPVMERCDHQFAGLSWQSFPVAFLHDDGDWGFLQWAATEDGNTYAHPSHKKDYAREKGLSSKVAPPLVGDTFSIREKSSLLVLRRMPMISLAWTGLTDRLRVVSPTTEYKEDRLGDRCSRMTFKWPNGRLLSVARVTLSEMPIHQAAHLEGKMLDWEVHYDASAIPSMSDAVILWAFSVDAEIEAPPEIRPVALKRRWVEKENQPFNLDWKISDCHWKLRIDPVAKQPFTSL